MKAKTKAPRVTLVGAGPGDPDLLTIKGLRALETADAVLYDALVKEDLLAYAPITVPMLFVGKRAGEHHFSQSEINQLIVDYARSYGHVVRLKGGDPFVFGRGFEEKVYAEDFGIPVEVIPGISSASALATHVGMPLTMRGYSESFWVVTATTRNGQLSDDLALAAQSSATVVVLMGVRKLPSIVDCFRQAGKPTLPVAIIQDGTLPNQRVVLGTVETIENIAKDFEIKSPAVIVLGENVTLMEEHVLLNSVTESVLTSPLKRVKEKSCKLPNLEMSYSPFS